jgi:hypothetical protein
MATLTASAVAAAVREVTDEELEFYREHGSVKLPRLSSPELAGEVYRVGRELRSREENSHSFGLRADAEPFRAFEFSEPMYRSFEQLIDRRRLNEDGVAIRYGGDSFFEKPPHTGSWASYHQDAPEHGSDRVGETRFWIGVDEVTADMGPMRFIDRSHQEGPLAAVLFEEDGRVIALLEHYPKLAERLTPPIEYEPGDATVHHGYMAHGAGPNTTDRPRLSFLLDYLPAGVRYWNATCSGNLGSTRAPVTDDQCPIVEPIRA